jgi:fibrillarin-like rRNA methylase
VLQGSLRELGRGLSVKNVVPLSPYQKEHWAIITR